jgi:hypothetical protein
MCLVGGGVKEGKLNQPSIEFKKSSCRCMHNCASLCEHTSVSETRKCVLQMDERSRVRVRETGCEN